MRHAFYAGFAAIRRTPIVQAVAIGTIALSLMLVGLVRLAALNVGRIAATWGNGVQITVYLEDGVSPARARKIGDAISRLPGVDAVHSVEGREAWQRLRASLGDRASLLDGVEESMLPSSLEVVLREGLSGAIKLKPEFERLRRTSGVEEVEVMGDWVDRLVTTERVLRLAGWLLAALVGFACVYIVASTIRLGVFARREEIEILRLVGATDGFVKAPFLVEGALQGTVGASLSMAILYALFRVAAPEIERSLGSALCAVPLTFVGHGEFAAMVLLGTLLGLAGSSLAVSRHVRA